MLELTSRTQLNLFTCFSFVLCNPKRQQSQNLKQLRQTAEVRCCPRLWTPVDGVQHGNVVICVAVMSSILGRGFWVGGGSAVIRVANNTKDEQAFLEYVLQLDERLLEWKDAFKGFTTNDGKQLAKEVSDFRKKLWEDVSKMMQPGFSDDAKAKFDKMISMEPATSNSDDFRRMLVGFGPFKAPNGTVAVQEAANYAQGTCQQLFYYLSEVMAKFEEDEKAFLQYLMHQDEQLQEWRNSCAELMAEDGDDGFDLAEAVSGARRKVFRNVGEFMEPWFSEGAKAAFRNIIAQELAAKPADAFPPVLDPPIAFRAPNDTPIIFRAASDAYCILWDLFNDLSKRRDTRVKLLRDLLERARPHVVPEPNLDDACEALAIGREVLCHERLFSQVPEDCAELPRARATTEYFRTHFGRLLAAWRLAAHRRLHRHLDTASNDDAAWIQSRIVVEEFVSQRAELNDAAKTRLLLVAESRLARGNQSQDTVSSSLAGAFAKALDSQVAMMFMLDQSGSVGESNFNNILKTSVSELLCFLAERRGRSDGGSVGLKFAAVAYGEVQTISSWTTDGQQFRTSICHHEYAGGGTPTDEAFCRAAELFNTASCPVRIAFNFTDGCPNDLGATRLRLKQLEQIDVAVVGVGIGSGINFHGLKEMSSDGLAIAVTGFTQLKASLNRSFAQIDQAQCRGEQITTNDILEEMELSTSRT